MMTHRRLSASSRVLSSRASQKFSLKQVFNAFTSA